jgi:membrane associated rhomboid family serine protease
LRPPENWRAAPVTLWVAGIIAAAWLIASTIGMAEHATIWGGFIPARLSGPVQAETALAPAFLTPLTATLVHSGFAHLAFNLLILLFCGRSVESLLGSRSFILLFLIGAYAAAAAQYVVDPAETIPMVGASGAISAVLGAYAILFGKNRVKVAHPTLALWLHVLWLAAAWIGLQLLVGLTFETGGARIAVAAHIGGFLVGLALARPLLLFRYRTA